MNIEKLKKITERCADALYEQLGDAVSRMEGDVSERQLFREDGYWWRESPIELMAHEIPNGEQIRQAGKCLADDILRLVGGRDFLTKKLPQCDIKTNEVSIEKGGLIVRGKEITRWTKGVANGHRVAFDVFFYLKDAKGT